jgi:hypothetical protein
MGVKGVGDSEIAYNDPDSLKSDESTTGDKPAPPKSEKNSQKVDRNIEGLVAKNRVIGSNKGKDEPEKKWEKPWQADFGEFAKKTYESGRDLLGFLGKGVNIEKGSEFDKKLSGFLDNVGKLQDAARDDLSKTQKQINDLYTAFHSGNPPMSVSQLRAQVAPLAEHEKQLAQTIGKQEKLLEELTGAGARIGKDLEGVNEKMEGFKNLKGAAGKALFGLDILSNLSTLQEADPGNWGKNIPQAIAISAGKLGFDLATAKSKLNPAEAAVGIIKFGFEALGAKDNAAYKSLDAVSQALPIDIIGKGISQICDQGDALAKIAQSGDWSGMENLNQRNLQGKNGLVMQGASIIGDLMATGGKNIPSTGDALGLADSLGIFGHTEIPSSQTGLTVEDKVGLIGKLANGAYTNEDDTLKIQNILQTATPHQLAHVLAGVDTDNLLKSLRAEGGRGKINPVTSTVLDICNKAHFTQDPGVKRELYREAGEMIKQCYQTHRNDAIHGFQQYGRTLNSLPTDIRRMMMYGS